VWLSAQCTKICVSVVGIFLLGQLVSRFYLLILFTANLDKVIFAVLDV